LLGPFDEAKGQFDELDRQELYFSRPSELNDAMEGFKDLFWQGDAIVWRNLLRHYLYCLMPTDYMVATGGAKFTRSNCDQIIHQTPDDLPEAPVREVYRKICDDFFAHQVPNDLVSALSSRSAPVRREELSYYLLALSPLAIPLIRGATMWGPATGQKIEVTPDVESEALGKRALDSLGDLLKHPDYGAAPDAIALASELVFMQANLILDFRNEWTPEQAAVIFLMRDFAAYYVVSLEKLLYPQEAEGFLCMIELRRFQ
jgi:hypothetical protein